MHPRAPPRRLPTIQFPANPMFSLFPEHTFLGMYFCCANQRFSTPTTVARSRHPTPLQPPDSKNSQELPGDRSRYGRRWLVSIPADACLEARAGLCPRVLVSADDSRFLSEFQTISNATLAAMISGNDDDEAGFREELVSQGAALSGTDAAVTSSRWIEGWRGCEQQVVSVATTNGSLSGTFQLRYEDQATAPLDVNASAEAVEVSGSCLLEERCV